jgi:hypothetical protein
MDFVPDARVGSDECLAARKASLRVDQKEGVPRDCENARDAKRGASQFDNDRILNPYVGEPMI